jgi:hypothetical protein
MPPDPSDTTRIRELLEKFDEVTAESKRLREHVERVRAAAHWPAPGDRNVIDSPPEVSDKKTRP